MLALRSVLLFNLYFDDSLIIQERDLRSELIKLFDGEVLSGRIGRSRFHSALVEFVVVDDYGGAELRNSDHFVAGMDALRLFLFGIFEDACELLTIEVVRHV